jgi:hypothetical protein
VPGGSVTISLPPGTTDQFVYASLATPATLSAYTAYYLVSQTNGGDPWYQLSPVTATNAVDHRWRHRVFSVAATFWWGALTPVLSR